MRHSIFRSISKASLLLALMGATTGCGIPTGSSYRGSASAADTVTNSTYAATSNTATANADYNCPKFTNISPDYDAARDGSDYYSICTHKEKTSDILIHGETTKSDQICVFPVEYVDSEHYYLKPSEKTLGPWYQCGQTKAEGVHLSFESINYNAAFIVEGPMVNQMYTCLVTARYLTCPAFSFGRFR